MRITKPGRNGTSLDDRVYGATNVCESCGCEWQITSTDRRAFVAEIGYILYPGEWRLMSFGADFPMPGLFVESHCPGCGRFTSTRIGDAE